ncbi:MAG: hypothetical protein II786_03180 [Muribaculaceae bacterium]|nr:hypothetical protein [Muribaculaceae bacterium]
MMTFYEHLLSLAIGTFVTSSVFAAILRWFHMCHPFDQEPDYYYPNRRKMTLCLLSPVLLVPFVLRPASHEAWMFAKMYFLIMITFMCPLLLMGYFGSGVKQWDGWKKWARILALPILAILGTQLVATIIPGQQLPHNLHKTFMGVAYVVGGASTLWCAYSMWWVYKKMKEVINNNYSNPDDFPVSFAHTALYFPLFLTLLVWPTVLSDSRACMGVMAILLSAFDAYLIVLILHPHRQRPVELALKESEAEEAEEQSTNKTPFSQQTAELIISQIKDEVEGKQLFLDSHLTLNDVAERCSYGRTYVSNVFKNELGGFFNYINALRLKYAEEYKQEHPMATQEEIAQAAGFVSRQAYYTVKKRMG